MAPPTRQYVQSRRAELRAETRARILAAARELIPTAESSLPVGAIARHSGVAIQTIYDQFGSKGGLLVALIADLQASLGLFEEFRAVFSSAHGEQAMRRMIEVTIAFWGRAWPFLEFALRVRRIDPVVRREMEFLDRLRHAHYWAITKRLEDEGRVRQGRSAEWAADQAFALTIPNVYEELAINRSAPLADVVDAVTEAVLAVVLEPGASVMVDPPPDWSALEAEAAARAKGTGADPTRLSPNWRAAAMGPTGPSLIALRPAVTGSDGSSRTSS
jgi:AcrR family transcriptional regulator